MSVLDDIQSNLCQLQNGGCHWHIPYKWPDHRADDPIICCICKTVKTFKEQTPDNTNNSPTSKCYGGALLISYIEEYKPKNFHDHKRLQT